MEVLEWLWRRTSQATKASAYDCAGGPRDNDGARGPVDAEGFISVGGHQMKTSQWQTRAKS
jgi:hypothetical protein